MRTFSVLAATITAAFTCYALAVPIIVHPGDANDLLTTSRDTVNETISTKESADPGHLSTATFEQLSVSVYNNINSNNIKVYVTGLDPNRNLVLLTPNGTWYRPAESSDATGPQKIKEDIAIPIGAYGTATPITLPTHVSSGRIWVADGDLTFFTAVVGVGILSLVEPSAVNPNDPSAAANWGFVELTTDSSGITVNLSYVDFVGLPLGIEIQGSGGTQTTPGVVKNALSSICNALAVQSSLDGQPWKELCMTNNKGNILRVISPYNYMALYPTAFDSYWTNYISQAWSTYEDAPLTVDTQASAGLVNCTVSSGILTCAGDNRGYPQPVASDIFGCNSGPFELEASDNAVHQAVVPRLCAAINRSTLLLGGGNVQPRLASTHYYTVSPTNYYSKFVHQHESRGKGYAFAYDDVTPDDAPNASGLLSDPNPTLLTITIGGSTA
ncbi:hypothetical protein N7489_008135 [Penicillium chrysogenum]|jgi:hypothetical protein|uniref:GH64 domain-containing protein n=1 Tax=Penicillium chrysogenum TaxID=5076 RepID=A0ABQ8WA39_PENCH|nr:uncharacterized protein N7489_008135 [Penicillium chrysogenum]KAJ5238044.1 hypothetical protein N7489_008135 [Penicillium chrysogenum]KAJ5261699.1 hypothetical protein N7505_008566 [Penicillium chrysogenum]KAJ5278348.1 hypothetical protein N7524_004501 [Penicillium chrysogenum]KAJ6159627.1 hypothetical protein N7497_004164 [Penicillium chrysogenum]